MMKFLGSALTFVVSACLAYAITPEQAQELSQPCPTTNCPTLPQCPHRPAIDCLVHRSIIAGMIDVKTMIGNPTFASEFGTIKAELGLLENQLDTGMGLDFSAIKDSYVSLIGNFRTVLVENCVIPVRSDLVALLEKDIDSTLDDYFLRYRRNNPPLEFCPHRQRVLTQLRLGQSQGFLDAIQLLLRPNMAPVMGNLPTMIRSLLQAVNSQMVASIEEISQNMVEYKVGFVMLLEERCVFYMREDLLAAIEASFDGRCEGLVARYKQVGGRNPEFCPNRDAILNAVEAARESGRFNAIQIIMDPTLDIEFGALNNQRTTLIQNIRNRMYTSVSEVLQILRAMRSAFIARIESDPGCLIPVREDLRNQIYESFDHFTLVVVKFYVKITGRSGVNGCPSRAVIERLLNRAVETGNLDASAIIFDPRLEPEFGIIKNQMEALHTRIQTGNVVDRASIAEILNEYMLMFTEIEAQTCMIEDPTGRIGDLLLRHFDGLVENYCDDFRKSNQNTILRKFKKAFRKRVWG